MNVVLLLRLPHFTSCNPKGQGTGAGNVAAQGELRPDEGSDGGQEASGGGEASADGVPATAAK